MKTKVIVTSTDYVNRDYEEGEEGYVDGYIRGGDDRPYACVVIEKRIALIPIYALKVYRDGDTE